MSFLSPFISFEGRIGRLTFWIGLILLTAVSPFAFSTLISADPFGEMINKTQNLGLKGFIWSLALMFCLAALLTKRLHDRNKTGLYALLFYGPALLKLFQFYTGQTLDLGWLDWVDDWGWLIGLELGAVGIWFLIELGFFGGVEPNKYGD